MASHATDLAVRVSLRAFQAFAIAEGGLLPAVLVVALIHWIGGHGAGAVAVVGAMHGTAFTAYVLLAPAVARLLCWSPRTLSVALSVAFVPFAPWAFERRIHNELVRCVALHRPPRGPEPATRS